MSIRRTEIQKLKTGQYIMVDEEPCIIKSTERSKSGKHGHAKVRVVCVGIFDNNKRSLTIPSGHMVETPEIIKGTAVAWPAEEDLINKLKDLQANPSKMSAAQVEVWNIAGKTLINRVIYN